MVARLGFRISTSTPASKESLLACLSTHLVECMRLRREGSARGRLAYEQGYADGVTRSLLDAGLVSEKELLDFIADQRRKFDGPAATSVTLPSSDESGALAQAAS